MIRRCWKGFFLKEEGDTTFCKFSGKYIDPAECLTCKSSVGFIRTEDIKADSSKPTVVFVCDRPGWTFDLVSNNIAKAISSFCTVKIICQTDPMFIRDLQQEADLWFFHNILPAETAQKDNYIVKIAGQRSLDMYLKKGGYGREALRTVLDGRHVVALSAGLASQVEDLAESVTIIPNGLDIDTFKRTRKTEIAPFTIGFAGNITGVKKLAYKGFPYVSIICDEENIKLRPAIYNERTNKPTVTYNEMPRFYNNISCLVHPSVGEGSSNVIMEALASGTPVITTKVGYHGEMLKSFKNVIFIKRSLEEIRGAVKFLANNPKIARSIGDAGRKFAEKHHNLHKLTPLWKNVILTALEDN